MGGEGGGSLRLRFLRLHAFARLLLFRSQFGGISLFFFFFSVAVAACRSCGQRQW